MIFVIGLWTFVRALLFGSEAIAIENLALPHQLVVLQRSVSRPHVSRWDRIVWVWLSRVSVGWRSSLAIVQPATVLAWHRQGFQLYWRWKSRPNPVGRPRLDAEIRHLIRQMARENPTWGRRRIKAELAELTVAKYMHPASPRLSPTWRAFLKAHARAIVAIDFFLVPTLTLRLLFVFVVLRHERRELLRLNVTDHPTAAWTARQLVEAFPDDTAPSYLLRDRDEIYGEEFARRVEHMGIRQVIGAPRAPWQNPFVERLIGSIRRECLDHFVILSEAPLRRLLRAYLAYYNHRPPASGARAECSPATGGAIASTRARGGDPAGRRAPSRLPARGLIAAVAQRTRAHSRPPPRCVRWCDPRTSWPRRKSYVAIPVAAPTRGRCKPTPPSPRVGGSRRSGW